jgi:diamine N-acetyltransferase
MTTNNSVTLRDITRDNFQQCVGLEVRDDQKTFVATNVYSIAQTTVEPTFIAQAVYHGDEMVGFCMYGRDTDEDCYCVGRLMIDQRHQGKGYGRAAMREAIRRMREQPDCREIALSVAPENTGAQKLYESLGFVKTGEVAHGEEVMRLRVISDK